HAGVVLQIADLARRALRIVEAGDARARLPASAGLAVRRSAVGGAVLLLGASGRARREADVLHRIALQRRGAVLAGQAGDAASLRDVEDRLVGMRRAVGVARARSGLAGDAAAVGAVLAGAADGVVVAGRRADAEAAPRAPAGHALLRRRAVAGVVAR